MNANNVYYRRGLRLPPSMLFTYTIINGVKNESNI